MTIIDGHAHIFPDKIAAKAALGTGAFYDLPVVYDGTADALLAAGRRAGISRYLVHSVATTPEQAPRINDFIYQMTQTHEEFIGFAALHQEMPEVEKEIARALRMGLKGVKMHPDIQRFQVDDPRWDGLYNALAGRLPLLLHTGDKRYAFSNPQRVANVLDKFPGLDVICAHFGGYSEWDEAERHLAGRRVWVDTSSSLPFLSPERARQLVDAFGDRQVIFGTDYPMWDASEELARLDKLALTPEARARILHENISELLGLKR